MQHTGIRKILCPQLPERHGWDSLMWMNLIGQSPDPPMLGLRSLGRRTLGGIWGDIENQASHPTSVLTSHMCFRRNSTKSNCLSIDTIVDSHPRTVEAGSIIYTFQNILIWVLFLFQSCHFSLSLFLFSLFSFVFLLAWLNKFTSTPSITIPLVCPDPSVPLSDILRYWISSCSVWNPYGPESQSTFYATSVRESLRERPSCGVPD